MNDTDFDVIVIGGGPAGATTALALAKRKFKTLVIEKDEFPRFHIGESFLPRNSQILRELGLTERFRQLPHMTKYGAEFCFGDGKGRVEFRFDSGFPVGDTVTWNIERAPYDAMILDAARNAGADVRTGLSVKRVVRLAERDVAVQASDGVEYTAKYLADASGQGTVIGRHLNTRRVLPKLKKVAYFGHFKGVYRHEGERAGYPTVVMFDEGWFWMIPIDPVRTSIGLVLDADAAKQINTPPTQMLRWAISRCPVLNDRTKNAEFPSQNGVTADFSYRCEPYAGPGYFLVGDAATFVDPIFSTGVCLGMASGQKLADGIDAIERRGMNPERFRRQYIKFVVGSSSVFFRLVHAYYRHAFREMFLHGKGPFQMERAIVSLLGGHVFPRPQFKLRWRLRLFELFMFLQDYVRIVPRREGFSLLAEPEMPPQVITRPVQPARSDTSVGAA